MGLTGVLAERIEAPAVSPANGWARSVPARAARAILQALTLVPMVRVLCHPLRVEGKRKVRALNGPVVFAANHASHADTVAILAALPRRVRARTAPAAAEDYFFRGRLRGVGAQMAIGAFPFPRHGSEGLRRAGSLLAAGWNVLLFPEGTRSCDGSMRSFRPGVGLLASSGATIVPVALAGTQDILPKHRRLPRRRPVALVFGEPVRVEPGTPAIAAAAIVERRVRRLYTAARLLRPATRPSIAERVEELAASRAALWIAFGWAVAEALWWPIVPDVPVILLSAAVPKRFLPLAAAATAGSLAGGAVAYGAGAAGVGGFLLAHAPLVTPRMVEHARATIAAHGAGPLFAQPWSGVPYKVFAYQAAPAGCAFVPFVVVSALGRGHRILLAGAFFAAVWSVPRRRWLRATRLAYVPFALAFSVVFGMGLGRVVAAWS